MDDNEAPVAGLTDTAEWQFALVALVLLGCHLLFRGSARHKRTRLLFGLVLLVAPLLVIALASARPLIRFSTIVASSSTRCRCLSFLAKR
jgi:predicted cobalt transporter CbtA